MTRRFGANASGKPTGVTASASELTRLAREAADCRACDLWRDATQTVFGEGPEDAR